MWVVDGNSAPSRYSNGGSDDEGAGVGGARVGGERSGGGGWGEGRGRGDLVV